MVKRPAAFLFLFLFLACCCTAVADSGGENETTWDFGKVKAGDVVKHDFVIKNDSADILRIKEINSSCGCTVSRIKKMVIKPGESTVIEVKLNSKGYSGKIKQFIYVSTDNLDKPVIRYIIEAEVIDRLENPKLQTPNPRKSR
ncbi:MAG: DUF1573 domain-containing protein [Candidatus Omnitrophota bacterium]